MVFFFATAGQDGDVVIWRIMTCAEIESQALLHPKEQSSPSEPRRRRGGSKGSAGSTDSPSPKDSKATMCSVEGHGGVVCEEPWRTFSGHTKDVVALSWSKSQFLISGGMDQTVRLWHVTKESCLRTFHHTDVVTCLHFHPEDDSLFVSGSFDKKLRMWDAAKGEILHWQGTEHLITALTLMESGPVVAGFINGQCIFYNYSREDGFQFNTEIDCKNRGVSSRKAKKVSGIQAVRIVATSQDTANFSARNSMFRKSPSVSSKKSAEIVREYVLVTTNDSRVRLFETDGYACIYKFKGATTNKLQIAANASSVSNHIICASEDKYVYLWEYDTDQLLGTHRSSVISKIGVHTTKISSYEAFAAHDDTVTAALFLPYNGLSVSRGQAEKQGKQDKTYVDMKEESPPEDDPVLASPLKKSLFGKRAAKSNGLKESWQQSDHPLYDAILITTGTDGHIHVFENNSISSTL